MLIDVKEKLFEKYWLKCAMISNEDTPLLTFTLTSRTPYQQLFFYIKPTLRDG